MWTVEAYLKKFQKARIRGVPTWRPWEAITWTCEDEAMKSGLPWKPQGVGDARAMEYLPRRAAACVWNQTKLKKCVCQQSWKELDIWSVFWPQTWRHRNWSLSCCFSSCFAPVFTLYAPFPPFLEQKYITCATVCYKYMIYIFNFSFMEITVERLPWLSEETLDFGLLNSFETVTEYGDF